MPQKNNLAFAALSAAFTIACGPLAYAQSTVLSPPPIRETTTTDAQSVAPPPNVSAWKTAVQSANPDIRAKALAAIPNVFGWNSVSGSLRMRLVSNQSYVKDQTVLAPILAKYIMAEASDFRGERGEQAAAVLAAIGPTATHVALPAFLICLSRYPSPPSWGPRSFNADDYVDKMIFWNSMSADIIQLCGEPETACTLIQKCLTDQNPQVRLGAACTLGTLSINPPYQDKILQNALWKTMPALASVAANDKRPDIRFAALNSLDRLAFGSEAAPWQDVFPALGRSFSSPQDYERQWAARVLADAPVSPTAVLPQIRKALLDKDVVVKGFALVALVHTDKAVPGSLQALLLSDLKSANPTVRRATAEQMCEAVTYLWGYGNFGRSLPPGVDYNDRYTDNYSSRLDENAHTGRSQLIAGLVQTLQDSDAQVRHNAALTLQQIGEMVNEWLSYGGVRMTASQDRPGVLSALEQAQKAMEVDDPTLSARLGKLISDVAATHSVY